MLIDIHCHIVPGVDDGAKNQIETLEMLKQMKKQDVVAIIATPHYRIDMFEPDMDDVKRRFAWTRKKAEEQNIRMWLGNECYVSDELFDALESGKCRSIRGNKYILIEFSRMHNFNTIREYISRFVMNDYIPIIAHIERVSAFDNDIDKIKEVIELGAKIQVNAESILGLRGREVKSRMLKLMKADLIDYIASDSHGSKERVPNLGDCYRVVKRKMGKEYAHQIFYENPKQIII